MVIPVFDEDGAPPRGVRPWVVWCVLAGNVLAFAYVALLPPMGLIAVAYHFGVVAGFITRTFPLGELDLLIPPELTLVTYMFLHPTWVHLAANMIFLWVFGDNVEAATGHWRFVVLYVMCGIAGALAHVASDPRSLVPLVGASGAVAGVVGAYLLLRPCAHVTVLLFGIMTVRLHAFALLGAWIVLQVVNVVVAQPGTEVSYWSHIGGVAAGLLLIPILRRRGVRLLAGFERGGASRRAFARVMRRFH